MRVKSGNTWRNWVCQYNCGLQGGECIPVDAPVFKIGGGLRRAGRGGFDSHSFPFVYAVQIVNGWLESDGGFVSICRR